jgi:hypothetical protein
MDAAQKSPFDAKAAKDHRNRQKKPKDAYFYFLAHCREEAAKAGESVAKVRFIVITDNYCI